MLKSIHKYWIPALVVGVSLVLVVTWFFCPPFKKFLLTTYLSLPSAHTIYEKNDHPEYPKTFIELPAESRYLIAVYKDKHKLQLYKDGTLVKVYDVNIRREKADAEVAEDDQSPEGVFMIETMDVVTDPPWERWMRLDTLDKAKRMYGVAYADGAERISDYEKQHGVVTTDADIRAFNKENPDQELLRGIGIHGGGFSVNRDWTEGCVGMADRDVIELFNTLKEGPNGGIGTKVVIQD